MDCESSHYLVTEKRGIGVLPHPIARSPEHRSPTTNASAVRLSHAVGLPQATRLGQSAHPNQTSPDAEVRDRRVVVAAACRMRQMCEQSCLVAATASPAGWVGWFTPQAVTKISHAPARRIRLMELASHRKSRTPSATTDRSTARSEDFLCTTPSPRAHPQTSAINEGRIQHRPWVCKHIVS